jgi:hypothetical protein
VRDFEEFPLSETVSRKRLVKTTVWIKLRGCCGELSIVEISCGAVLIVVTSGVKVDSKSNMQSIYMTVCRN